MEILTFLLCALESAFNNEKILLRAFIGTSAVL